MIPPPRSTVSTLKTIKDDGALGSTVTLARESLSQAKSSTGYDSLSSSVDAAAHQLAESVKQEMEGSKAAQEIADEVKEAKHDKAIGDYAKYKGKEMQGEAELVR